MRQIGWSLRRERAGKSDFYFYCLFDFCFCCLNKKKITAIINKSAGQACWDAEIINVFSDECFESVMNAQHPSTHHKDSSRLPASCPAWGRQSWAQRWPLC